MILLDTIGVDNAYTDGSPERILEKYGDQVTLLQNAENLRGSGGFNTGLRLVLEKGYSYAMCLDDDAMVDEQAISELYTYLEQHPDTGMGTSDASCRGSDGDFGGSESLTSDGSE